MDLVDVCAPVCASVRVYMCVCARVRAREDPGRVPLRGRGQCWEVSLWIKPTVVRV